MFFIDIIFNIGDFYVIFIIYRYLLLDDRRIENFFFLFGLILIYMRKDSDIFSYFGVIFIGFENGIRNI